MKVIVFDAANRLVAFLAQVGDEQQIFGRGKA
jgi:hypothetical protein